MIFYMIQHRRTGEFMPELKRRGYSHWNPDKAETATGVLKNLLIGTPRLFKSIRSAKYAIVGWKSTPNGRYHTYQSHGGDWDEDIHVKPDGRKKEDLLIVKVEIKCLDWVEP